MDRNRHRGAQRRAGSREGGRHLQGRRFETPYERTTYEPDRLFKERAAGGPIPDQEWTYTFEEVPGGATRLTRAVEGEPGGFFKLADPLIERALKRQVRIDLETIKDLLEARS